MAVRSQPPPEMIGVVGESAHIRRPDVQSMTLVFGRVSEPASDLRAWFDQRKTNGVAGESQEMRGHQGAARAASEMAIEQASAFLKGASEASMERAYLSSGGLTNVY